MWQIYLLSVNISVWLSRSLSLSLSRSLDPSLSFYRSLSLPFSLPAFFSLSISPSLRLSLYISLCLSLPLSSFNWYLFNYFHLFFHTSQKQFFEINFFWDDLKKKTIQLLKSTICFCFPVFNYWNQLFFTVFPILTIFSTILQFALNDGCEGSSKSQNYTNKYKKKVQLKCIQNILT